jgi:simple sugar transport system permease protein
MQDVAGQTIFFILKVLTRSAVVVLLAILVLSILVGETGLGDISLGGNLTLSTFFGKSALNFTLRAAIPLTLGALSGIMCERSGIINIGIEGMMLGGAFAAFVIKVQADALPLNVSLALGVLAALIIGGLMGWFHALMSIRYKVDQIISGTVIIILAAGLTTFLFDPAASSKGKFGPVEIPLLSKIPVLGDVLFSNALITYVAILLVFVIHVMLFHTRWGLRTRSVGEHPRAADTVGINVNRMRYINVIIGGTLAGLAGAFLVLEAVGQFKEGMTAGRGFIALAAMIFGNWTPFGAFGASLLFGYTGALQNELLLAGVTSVPRQFVAILPYVTTIVVLAGVVGRTRPPAAAGQVYESE